VRTATVRQFFALANQHKRWERNDLTRRLDEQTPAVALRDEFVAAQDSSNSQISPVASRLLEAIEALPEEEREVFSLVRIQGMQLVEAANILDVSPKTIRAG
jgi:RNA polymerase sigma-70 factor (ECF subfamily)